MSQRLKFFLLTLLLLCSVIGFMVRLPRLFHHFDKELHFMFYFFSSLVFLLMFPKRWVYSVLFLLFFGIGIEYAQEFSNKISIRLIGKAIHGRFDIVDVKYNVLGLTIGWLMFHFYLFIRKQFN